MENDLFDQLPGQEIHRLWELYLQDATTKKLRPTVKDFTIWLEEEGYTD